MGVAVPTYLLDANIPSYFFSAGAENRLADICAAVPLVVVEEVRDELVQGSLGPKFKKWLATSKLAVRQLHVGGKGAGIFTLLRTGTTSLKDAGEHASIALAVEDPTLNFVTNDQKGAWLALAEVFEPEVRVVRFPVFLRAVSAVVPLEKTLAEKLALHGHFHVKPPTWWPAWLATLP